MRHVFTIAAFALVTPLVGCAGFQPMHSTAASQSVFSDMSVTVGDGTDELDRAAGYMIRQRLADRIDMPSKPTYQLMIKPTVQRAGLGLSGQDFATRYDSVVMANWSLTKTSDGSVVTKGRARSTATYSADRDPYRLTSATDAATDRAARDLADQVLRDVTIQLAEMPTP